MAPYAIAHLKLGLKLYETGYTFDSNERARIFLTNTLEPPQEFSGQFQFVIEALAHEARAVNAVKRDQRFTVVIGNPPYSGISSNMMPYAQRLVDAYKVVDGEALNERKLWLQDDYVKFIRAAQVMIDSAGSGILGYITNHGYLDNPTFRGMRQSLITTFEDVKVLDLHGNANKKERAPDRSEDQNVFQIRQGVAIGLLSRVPTFDAGTAVSRSDLWGLEQYKTEWLAQHMVGTTQWSAIHPTSPFYLLAEQSQEHRDDYELGWKVTDAMPVTSAGFITARDHFVVDIDRSALEQRMNDFAASNLTDAEIRKRYFAKRGSDKYSAGDTRGWKLTKARKIVKNDALRRSRIRKCLYRPFDERFIYWATWMIDWPRPAVMGQMVAGGNVALITSRMTKGETFAHTQVTQNIAEVICMSPKTSNNGFVFPLWIYEEPAQLDLLRQHNAKRNMPGNRHPNFAPDFLDAVGNALNLELSPEDGLPADVTAYDIFNYIYAVLHSPEYRKRYAAFLKLDFPRIPLTTDLELFRVLAAFGSELVSLHLLQAPTLEKVASLYFGPNRPTVQSVSWSGSSVRIDGAAKKTPNREPIGFAPVPEEVWGFHVGGYQVCEKWLKDRKERQLFAGDISHYEKIVAVIKETLRIMNALDAAISVHGGWGSRVFESDGRHPDGGEAGLVI